MTDRPPAAQTGPPPSRGLFRSRLRDARIRSKLGLILIVPLIAVVALGAVRLVDSAQRALSADLVLSLATVSAEASDVAHELHGERMAAARLLSDPELDPSSFNARAGRTDEIVEEYQRARGDLGDLPGVVEERLLRIDDQLGELEATRQQVLGEGAVSPAAAVQRYGVILDDILAYQESVGQLTADVALGESIRAVAALSKAKEQMAEAQAVAFLALRDGVDDDELTAFLAAQTGQQEALLTFAQVATAEQAAQVDSGLTGDAVVAAEAAATSFIQSVGQSEPNLSATAADRALGAMVNNSVIRTERDLHADQVAFATNLRDNVFQQVLIESIAVLLALVIAIAVAVLLARMLARSLGQLRANALAVAERELPETVARLSDPRTLGENTPAQLAAQVREPIQLRSRDEIGQVAQSFNVVHRAAVRVAAEQAALRTSVSAMFLNLARRSQSLVDRMISQLDEIERNEEDPKRLARMFTLDHLATRMRRNDENLLVLAGADSSPPRSDDALVADALRAAQSEVEHYDRIEFGTIDSDVSVVSGAVNDTVRLVAELFDNATRFSPPDSAVVCEARRLGDQVIIQVEDRGVGMSQDQVSRLNAWLATPPAVEVTTFRKMGLAVVARLASRHQIRVELRCDPNYGTIAYVALPRSILVLPRSRMRGFEIPAPRSPMPVEQAPTPAPAAPPLPSRHLGQLPRRPATVAQQAAPGHEPDARATREHPQVSGGNHEAAGNHGAAGNYGAASNYGTTGNYGATGNHVAAGNQPPAGNQVPAGNPVAAASNGQVAGDGSRADVPVAGRPLYELTTQQPQAAAAAPPARQPGAQTPEATVELPIFREMETAWFRSHGSLDLGRQANAPSAGSYPAAGGQGAGAGTPPPASAPAPEPAAAAASTEESTEAWQTAADSGWRAAAAAAQPQAAGATQSGLPKRVPNAQLVPGSVEAPAAASTSTHRRSPEEVRGLLSAYHRGVQRGREGGGR